MRSFQCVASDEKRADKHVVLTRHAVYFMHMKAVKTAYDYHGVLDEGVEASDSPIIITGADEKEEGDMIREEFPDAKIYFFKDQDSLTDENRSVKIGAFKAAMIRQLGIERYYEDDPDQVILLKELTDAEIVPVTDGIPAEPMKFLVFTLDGTILPVAKKLKDEGNVVVVGMIDNEKNVMTDEQAKTYKSEDPKEKEARWKRYEGILEKHPAEKLIKEMKSLKDKDEWFVLSDSNNTFRFTEMAKEMGFKKGFFPTQENREFEENRTMAKEFVKEHYPGIEIGEVHEFKDVEDGKSFIKDSDKMWVLKSQGDAGCTIVPKTDDLDQAKEQIMSALEEHAADYEQDGFILEEFICDPIELTPEVCFYDGIPVYFTLDIENKPMGSGNIGVQVGCAQNLIVRTERDDKINTIAFPEIVYEMAKAHQGMFVWDCSILMDKNGKMFFGEFCSNRPGWCSWPTEMTMCESLTLFFRKMMLGKNPITKKFGASVRVLNVGGEHGMQKDAEISMSEDRNIFVYDCYGDMKTAGLSWELASVTGSADSMYEAVDEAYCCADKITLETKYFRPKFDFLSYDYATSIPRRLDYAYQHQLIGTEEGKEVNSSLPAAIPASK